MTNNGKVKTGIFSGSFNPIHIGHLALSNYLCEYEGLDEVWFMVSPQNPLKTQGELWSEELRLHLVQLAIEDYSGIRFRVSPSPSFLQHTHAGKVAGSLPRTGVLFHHRIRQLESL